MFSFLEKCAQLAASKDDMLRAIERWRGNYTCWKAHMVRAIHQQTAIETAMQNLQPDTAMVLVDFKVRRSVVLACSAA